MQIAVVQQFWQNLADLSFEQKESCVLDTMKWNKNALLLLDQTKLPIEVSYISCESYRRVGLAIEVLEVRGAPAIGAAAAYAFVLAGQEFAEAEEAAFTEKMKTAAAYLRSTRPTAVNLFWALNRMEECLAQHLKKPRAVLLEKLLEMAETISEQDKVVNHRMAEHGAALFTKPMNILTHCNAGALATVGWGTALGVIRQAYKEGHVKRVFADETRPLLQGARLTAFELQQDGIPVTLITDNMAGWCMKQGKIDAVIVGADRIAANGDTANKIGTYSVAVLAKAHGIPFYVAAPASTFDFSLVDGSKIPIEERNKDEVTHVQGVQTAPLDVDVFNPAFDVTPNSYISGIITEHGILSGDYTVAIQNLKKTLGDLL
jgi:methylthioribose-1-phosphate isomerase